MKICRFDEGRLGLVEGSHVVDVTAATRALPPLSWPVPHGDHAIRHLDILRAEIARVKAKGARLPLADVTLLSPVANPSKVLAAPLNYTRHLDESRADAGIHHHTHATEFKGAPVDTLGLFLKASTAVAGPGEGIEIAMPERRNDHEVELALVIGREGKRVAETDALALVAGWCIGLDMTVRGPEERSFRKSPDGYAVLGPWLVTVDEIADPGNLALGLDVNGEARQRANTRDLTVGLARLISLASHWYRLYPGDVILTGTPEGVGSVEAGDVIEAWIDGIGRMTVTVR